MGVVRFIVTWKVVVLLSLLPLAALAQGRGASVRDTIVMHDTLIESRFTIEHSPLRAGFEPSYGGSFYGNSYFPKPISQPDCDHFKGGSGALYGLRASAEIPFWGDVSPWKFEPGLFLEITNPNFEWLQPATGYDSGQKKDFTALHTVSPSVFEAGVESRMEYSLTNALALHGGIAFGVAVSQSYTRTIHLSNAAFDRKVDSTVLSGDLSSKLTMLPSAMLSASYEVPLSRKLRAAPELEVDYTMALSEGRVFWQGLEVKAGVSFMFDLTPRLETVPTFRKEQVPVVVHIRDTTRPLTASIEAVAVSRSGQQSKVVQMRIEEVRTRNSNPILNYIFFDENSSEFPRRYVQYATYDEAQHNFKGSTQRVATKLMDLYRETLNILGDRLTRYPKSSLRLIGSTSGAEANGLVLARARAERVKNYLVNVWKIDASRVRVEGKLLPERPSPVATAEGREENRRVEFQVDDEHVTDPIIVTNIEHLATPDRITLNTHVSRLDILKFYASIQAGGVEVQSFSGGAKGSGMAKIWAPTEDMLSKIQDSLSIEYDVYDSAGHHAHAHSSIALDVQRVTSDRPEKVERYSLILFGFDESRLERRNDREARRAADMIDRIPVEQILVQGFTDETGDPQHNDRLSQERAEQVSQRLKALLSADHTSGLPEIHSEGRGSRDLLYDNSLPEGRFFSRTVTITIERAIK